MELIRFGITAHVVEEGCKEALDVLAPQDRLAGKTGCAEMTIVPDAEDFGERLCDPLVAGGMRYGIPQPLAQCVDRTGAAEIFADDIWPEAERRLAEQECFKSGGASDRNGACRALDQGAAVGAIVRHHNAGAPP